MTKEELAKKKGKPILKPKTAAERLITGDKSDLSANVAVEEVREETNAENNTNTTTDSVGKEQIVNLQETEEDIITESTTAPSKPIEKTQKVKKTEVTKQESSKSGRPKGRPSTKISLNVPNDYMEMVDIAAAIKFKGNTSAYISSLIEQDIVENEKLYNQIKKLKK